MIVSLPSAALHGVDAYRVDVEVDVSGGLPAYQVVGMAATSIKEGASRIRSALRNCGLDLPARKITVNLAPADRRKDGAAFDLPVALGVLVGGDVVKADALDGLMFLGELGLDGTVRPVRGVLAAASLAIELGLRGIVVPREGAAEASAVTGLEIYAVGHLGETLAALRGESPLPRWVPPASGRSPASPSVDFSDVRGQPIARRAVEIAVAGGHNLLLYGQPGVGKTMLARRIPTILPEISRAEAIEVTKIYSAAGLSPPGGLVSTRPFRAPHHSASAAALLGGGTIPRPGEISLAHRGVLFLDEIPEFPRGTLEALREPLEDRSVRISRVSGSVRFPAAFFLVASANPCPCGWYGSDRRSCTCPLGALERYRSRLSGPLLDRIDLQVRAGGVTLDEVRSPEPAESSAAIRGRVEEARERQARRLAPWRVSQNGEMPDAARRATCQLTAQADRILTRLGQRRPELTGRGIDRILRAARTIADLAGTERIDDAAIAEAASYRAFETDPLIDPRQYIPPGVVRPPDAPSGTRTLSDRRTPSPA